MAAYAYFCFVKFGMLPSTFAGLNAEDRAMIIAMVRLYNENKKKEEQALKRKH